MRRQVFEKLSLIQKKYTQEGIKTSCIDGETAVFTFSKDDVSVRVKLYTEPLETSYFNIDATVEVKGGYYLYNGSEREYDGMGEEISVIDGIIDHAINHRYDILQSRMFLFFHNTYMRIKLNNYELDLLKVK